MLGLSFAALDWKFDHNEQVKEKPPQVLQMGRKQSGYDRRWIFEESCPKHASHPEEADIKIICYKARHTASFMFIVTQIVSYVEQRVPN